MFTVMYACGSSCWEYSFHFFESVTGASVTGMRVWTVEGPGRANCQEVRAALALGIPGSVHALHSLMTMSKNARYIALS